MELNVVDEHYPGKVVGIYNEESCANKLSEKLIKEGGFLVEQISTESIEDIDFEHKLEPDSKGIGQTALRSHLILGLRLFGGWAYNRRRINDYWPCICHIKSSDGVIGCGYFKCFYRFVNCRGYLYMPRS
jgi:hypothetical protein